MSVTEPEQRVCDKCSGTDGPFHIQYVALIHPVTGDGVDMSVSKHIDCCAEDGCEVCGTDVARATEDGTAIPEFVLARPDDHQQLLFDKFGIEPDPAPVSEEA